MDRVVRRIKLTPLSTDEEELRPLSAYDDASNVVLLGDPGAGKTYTFRESAARCGGRYITARAFLVTPATKIEGALFIDGLDEKRAGRADRDTVDALVEKLFATNPDKVRISCRVADWLGDSDIAALRPYFELRGDPIVLQLERLSEAEQRAVLQAERLDANDADSFLSEATDRGLTDFLANPQNLIMLLGAVRTGKWPVTRKELFELSTQIALQEPDKGHARSGSGIYTANELRPAAGAICAARLISDIEAVSLTDHETSPSVPSYRSLSMFPPEKVIAALTRRVFVAGSGPESVDYGHRTTAEYLAAAWLASVVRNGMPFVRLQALIGIDGHPAPELRGLHAWLAVHLPEYADRLIDADPYGVLTYGDAASLSRSSCAHLVDALGKLSQTDPSFRSGNWEAPAIGGLSRADMVDEFRAVLHSKTAGFGVRSIIVQAVAVGAAMPALKSDLIDVVLRSKSSFAERHYALLALLRIGPEGKSAAQSAFDKLGTDTDGLRLRAEMIQGMYGEPFGPTDITRLLEDMAKSRGETTTGVLYALSEHLPAADIPVVLDRIPPARHERRGNHRNEWEIARFIDRALVRAWRELPNIEPARAIQWLRLRNSYSSRSSSLANNVRTVIRGRPDLLTGIANHFFGTLVPDEDRWLHLHRFRELTLMQVTPGEMLDHLIAHMERAPSGSEKQLFLYEAALGTTFSMVDPHAREVFESLFALADNRPELRPIRDASVSCSIPSAVLSRPRRNKDNTQREWKKLRRNFAKSADGVRNGTNLGWLTMAAQVYFGLFSNVDEHASPPERLVAVLGERNAQAANAGFVAVLSRNDLPSLAEVVALSARHQHMGWWHVITAGLMESWAANPTFAGVSDELLKAALAFDLANPVFEHGDGSVSVIVPGWKTALMKDRPELVRDGYLALARAKLAQGDQMVDGLRELMVEEEFKDFRGDIALELLRDFPNANEHRLGELFDGVFTTPHTHSSFLELAERVLTDKATVAQRQRDMWLAAAYVLSPGHYEAEVQSSAGRRPSVIFDLRDRTGYRSHGDRQPIALQLPQLEFLAGLTGTLYPQTGYPSRGWSGSTNPWDATEFCLKLINAISAVASEAATHALRRLEADTGMASYNAHLRHALRNQEQRRRDSEYDRPDWLSTIEALSNDAPATVGDLHALLLDQLDDLRKRIAGENTDIFKSFWNLDSHSRPKTPRPEEACRDILVTLLKPQLAPKGIMIEPEGHMAADKRADISAAMPGRKILCEWKRDYHPALWTAADQQLERFYVHDPDAKGFGIYGVFWFGDGRPTRIPRHPGGLTPPSSAAQLQQMLEDRIPADRRSRLAVVVVDVSGPSGAKRKRRPASVKNKKKKRVVANKAAGQTSGGVVTRKKRRKNKATTKSRRHQPSHRR